MSIVCHRIAVCVAKTSLTHWLLKVDDICIAKQMLNCITPHFQQIDCWQNWLFIPEYNWDSFVLQNQQEVMFSANSVIDVTDIMVLCFVPKVLPVQQSTFHKLEQHLYSPVKCLINLFLKHISNQALLSIQCTKETHSHLVIKYLTAKLILTVKQLRLHLWWW